MEKESKVHTVKFASEEEREALSSYLRRKRRWIGYQIDNLSAGREEPVLLDAIDRVLSVIDGEEE